ncbi:MAG: discoidin domain-containing protein [Candidatus Nitrosocosmicus sp.]|nr:discoidin domain-containing protein [Candidatus Nitrosocosmicus sp.]
MVNDPFGHTRLKPNAAGGESWVMNNNDFEGDSRRYAGKNGDSFHTSGGFTICDASDFRTEISTSTGFDDDQCSQDQQEMVDLGYMQAANDWKNVEFTGVFKIFDSAADHITIGFRGGKHTGSGGPRGCTGSNYKVSVEMNGNGIEIRKESWHVSYHDCTETSVSGWSSTDGEFGLKILVYNSQDDQSVTVQVYLDKTNSNNYEKVLDFTDSGQVNSDAGECQCNDSGQPLVWGSPAILIRGDKGEYGFKDITIYEIDPFGSGSGGGGTVTSDGYQTTSVTSSGDDGHVASNTRDGSFSTRWSSFGVGEYVQFDLGSAKPVDEVKVAWYLGNERTNNYVIYTSTDGSSFTSRKTGTSSGNTTSFESYTFASVSARYVRVTVNGNSANDWASITEVEIHGADSDTDTGGGGGGGTPPPSTEADFNILETIFALDYQAIGLCNPAGV